MNWQIFLDLFQYLGNCPRYVYALWRIAQLQRPIVTVFGGKHASKDSPYYSLAYEFAALLAQHQFSVITGGGPGIMESALCGIKQHVKHKNRLLGIGVKGVDVAFESRCAAETIFLSDFAARKWFLIRYSIAFVAFPGGIGTLDECAEVLNLIKTNRILPIPVILIGSTYWHPIITWIHAAIEQGFIDKEAVQSLVVTDDLLDAIKHIKQGIKGGQK